MHAVLLAGGKGLRLRPLTATVPKVLLPVDGVPVIERLIDQLQKQGIDQFTVVTGHMAAAVRNHLGSGARLGANIRYFHEARPLGTAGCLGRLDPQTGPLLVVNADIVTDFRFRDLVEDHQNSGAVATVAVCPHKVSIDLGVVDFDANGRMTGYREKPDCELWVSMGIYCFDSRACLFVNRDERISMPELLLRLRDAGETVRCFRSDCYWRDIGRPEDYAQANADVLRFLPSAATRRAA